MVNVGWMFILRRVISWPTWFTNLSPVAPGDDDAVAVLAVLCCGQFDADSQERRQHSTDEDAISMPSDPILQAGIPGRVGADQVVQRQR